MHARVRWAKPRLKLNRLPKKGKPLGPGMETLPLWFLPFFHARPPVEKAQVSKGVQTSTSWSRQKREPIPLPEKQKDEREREKHPGRACGAQHIRYWVVSHPKKSWRAASAGDFSQIAGKGLVVVREGISTPNTPYLSPSAPRNNTGGASPHVPPPLAARGFTRRREKPKKKRGPGCLLLLRLPTPAVEVTATCNKGNNTQTAVDFKFVFGFKSVFGSFFLRRFGSAPLSVSPSSLWGFSAGCSRGEISGGLGAEEEGHRRLVFGWRLLFLFVAKGGRLRSCEEQREQLRGSRSVERRRGKIKGEMGGGLSCGGEAAVEGAGEKKKISNGTGDCGCCPLLPGPEKWLKSACLPKPRMRRNRGFSREESQQGKEVGWGLSSSFLAEREGLNNGLGPGATASFG
ncbi:hypothetical protein NC652_005649 [Populus alba x Populus x berolinensis]|nr:hypothetical protein NC652_005649 [Populus alba x Populus x berolinensis]